MRRSVSALVALAALVFAGAAHAQSLSVRIDQAERIALRGAARDVIVGNPAIADVTVIDEHNLVVTGKGFGETNLIVLDGVGRTLVNRAIIVTAADEGRVSFYRGADVRSYSCSPRCEQTGQTSSGSTAPTSSGSQ